jgi:nitroreductase
MMNTLESIKNRTSVRTYSSKRLDAAIKTTLQALCQENRQGPFGVSVRLELLDLHTLPPEELRRFGTYGVIKGGSLYILAAVKDEPGAMEDVGYCLEKVILKATAMGLGTCWLAGTFRRSNFAGQMQLTEAELLPAITPVGYAAEKSSMVEKAMRYGARANRRKPWEELFFHADGKTPLSQEDAGTYRDALEAVRLGPSASNRQPWRFVKENEELYRLYLAESPRYNRILGKIRIQNIDMGIAMCHFQLAAEEIGAKGHWQPPAPSRELSGLQHIADWKPKK